MAYAILRTKKITTVGQMAGMQRHNQRTNNVLNADADLTHINQHSSKYKTGDLRKDIEMHLAQNNVQVRKNSVLAIEHLITFSPEFAQLEKYEEEGQYHLKGNISEIKGYMTDSLKWLYSRYGKENIVHFSFHVDETTPHLHAYVVPLKEKTIKWKNKAGRGEKKVVSLCARDYLGGKKKMQEMQDSFYEAVKKHGLERGKKGSLAKHEHVQKYYERVNKVLSFEESKPHLPLPAINLEAPGRFDSRERWQEMADEYITQLVKEEREKAVNAFKDDHIDQIAKAQESDKIIRGYEANLERYKDTLDEKDNSAVIEREKAERALKTLREKNNELAAWKEQTGKAIKYQDKEAIDNILDALHREENKRSKGKRMGR